MKDILFRTIARMIERGDVEGIEKKIDIFYAAGKLSDEDYAELIGALPEV